MGYKVTVTDLFGKSTTKEYPRTDIKKALTQFIRDYYENNTFDNEIATDVPDRLVFEWVD